jgi:AcrR family transcriptional regulator
MRTGEGDPARTLALLWRQGGPPRRGPRPKLTLDDVIRAAVEAADADGLESLTMRALAGRLGVSAMTLYTHVPGRAELVDLMLDALYLEMPREPWSPRRRWRWRLRQVAEANRELFLAHPWAARVSTARPPLGPGQLAKYDHELAALESTELDDVQMDAALTFLLGFVQSNAVAAQESAAAGSDAEWWEAAGPQLAEVVDPARYPLASRVGSAAGAEQDAAFDAERAYAFGLERVLDGLAVLIN